MVDIKQSTEDKYESLLFWTMEAIESFEDYLARGRMLYEHHEIVPYMQEEMSRIQREDEDEIPVAG